MSKILKHKVGDLVTVSYERDRFGIVTEIRANLQFPYKVQWLIEGNMKGNKSNFGHYSEGVLVPVEVVCE
jgi:hypothetical protein